MKYLLDTDVVVDHFLDRPRATGLIERLVPDGAGMSIVSYGELYEGVYWGRNPREKARELEEFVRTVDIVPLDTSTMRQFGVLRGLLRRRGETIADSDLMIAATGIRRNVKLVTWNIRHFKRVEELDLYEMD